MISANMKVKKNKTLKPPVEVEKSESEESEDEVSNDSAVEADEPSDNSEVEPSDSSDEDDDDDVPDPEDPAKANESILDEMDEGSDDEDEPEEISSKIPIKLPTTKPQEKPVKKVEESEVKKLAYEKEDEMKTVFCGNIPNAPNVNETRVKDLFSEYGVVRSVRFRSEAGKKIFSKKIKKECQNFNAYVVFEKPEDAQKSIQLNGFKLLDNHLRVNMANNKRDAFSNKGTIFVGNLPFDCTESEVHAYFLKVGAIEYVRKIATKGIAYVCFQKGVNLVTALKLNEKPFKGRPLRISRCESKDKQDKKKLFKKDNKTGKFVKQKVKRPHKMNEDAFMRGRANNNPIIKKIKDTQKAKFNKFSEARQPSKKELFRSGGRMDQNQREENRERTSKKQKFFGAKVDGLDKTKSKKSKVSKSIQQQKVFAKKLKSAASRSSTAT